MKSLSKQFNGEKEGYTEWFRTLKIDLLNKGLYAVATNQEERPPDILPEVWHFDVNQQGSLAVLTNKLITT
jgi:hypothetical protein